MHIGKEQKKELIRLEKEDREKKLEFNEWNHSEESVKLDEKARRQIV